MLHLQQLSLTQFKNYSNRSFSFDKRMVGICGNNGVGKTNILDAIHYLCFTKGAFSKQDGNAVMQGTAGFRIEGHFVKQDKSEQALCILRETGKKEFSINGEPYQRFSHHIGRYPCVLIAPDDAVLITGTSEERRNFLDELLCQLDTDYIKYLIDYNKILQQRNSFLKQAAESGNINESLLNVLDEQLSVAGTSVFEKRNQFLFSFLPKVKRLYNDIAQKEEHLTITYESKLLDTDFDMLLKTNRQKDLLLQRTTAGIHRDDLSFQLNNQPFKNIASQGQRKSLLFALKITELEILKTEKKFAPLLLLDDVFEKLDEERIQNLFQLICKVSDGQVFITDTQQDRLQKSLESTGQAFQIIEINNH